jgi:hypothetical protein
MARKTLQLIVFLSSLSFSFPFHFAFIFSLHLKFQLHCCISIQNGIDSFKNITHNTWHDFDVSENNIEVCLLLIRNMKYEICSGKSKFLCEWKQIHIIWNLSRDRVFNSSSHLAMLDLIFRDYLAIRNRISGLFFVITENTYYALISG